VISTAHGLKFADFKTNYHNHGLQFESKYANTPISFGSDPDGVCADLVKQLDLRK
jgi:threonine synthase